MRIIRFLDREGRICHGHDYDGDTAAVLEGELFDGLRDAGRRTPVRCLLAPLRPAAILCIGLNYHGHARETGAPLPVHPVVFMKNPGSVTDPDAPILLPRCCRTTPQVDYEVELAVVIGRTARDVPARDALDYVFGYTAADDVSARDWQKRGGAGQWVRGKSFDTFCPLGPSLVTVDDIPDPQALRLQCRVNGQLMQDGHTSDMIFSVADIIEFLTQDTTLCPGTVILTGTPSGVGFARRPPVFLKSGDRVEMTVDVIGTLGNPVVDAADADSAA